MNSLRHETRNTSTGGSRAELQINIRRSPPLGSKECHSALRKDELLATNDLGGRIPGQLVERTQTRMAFNSTASLASLMVKLKRARNADFQLTMWSPLMVQPHMRHRKRRFKLGDSRAVSRTTGASAPLTMLRRDLIENWG